VDNAGGAASLLKYKEATNPATPELLQLEARDWLIRYNRDDVKATYAAREFLRNLKV